MGEEFRLFQFYNIDNKTAAKLFIPFDKEINVDSAIPIHNGMSTSNYCIVSGKRKFLLKIYSGNSNGIEPIMYNYLKDFIHIPSLLYYDNSKMICPYSYAIIEFIEGVTFTEYVKTNQSYPMKQVYKIGEMLSMIHQKTYEKSGYLDNRLQIVTPVKSTSEFIMENLEKKPGKHITDICHKKLAEYVVRNEGLFQRIDQNFVLNHGDIGNGNILIAKDEVYFIDFEYALAESRYRDIGKFFRSKEPEIQTYITSQTYRTFKDGYCSLGNVLPEDWLQLARLADIPVMLGFLNRDNPPADWIFDIEHDIMTAIM